MENTKDYVETLEDLKQRIRNSQLKAAISVNRELIALYWDIGSKIIEKQTRHSWGSKVVERVAKDLRDAFPDMTGFSVTNVKYMAQFSKAYPDFLISQQAVGQIPWGHNQLILNKIREERENHARSTQNYRQVQIDF